MNKKILVSALFIFSFFISQKISAQYQPVDASRFNIYNAWDNVVTSTDDGLYHQLIGTYRGWDKRAIYIAGYNSSIASNYATERVYIGNPNLTNKFMTVDLLSGNVGIGTTSPSAKLQIIKGSQHDLPSVTNAAAYICGFDVGMAIGQLQNGNYGTWMQSIRSSDNISFPLCLNPSGGNVGIGTTNPTSKLTVAGNINSREVKVSVDAGADFVFEKDYALPSLQEVEKFVTENKHLPEIASAKEMQKEGINLSEMNIKLLQKIEELTLYVIEQNKKIELQQKVNDSQSKEMKVLKNEVESIKLLLNNNK